MRLLTRNDEEILKTIHFAHKFAKGQNTFFHSLEAEYRSGRVNKEIALAYGYYQYYHCYVTGNVTGKEVNVDSIFAAYDTAIRIDPNYWLAKLCKAICLVKFPFVTNSEIHMKKVFADMIELQGESLQKEGYFVFPYILYSDFLFTREKYSLAQQILMDGLKNSPPEPVLSQFFQHFFGLIFKEYYHRISFAKEEGLFAIMRELSTRVFPDQR